MRIEILSFAFLVTVSLCIPSQSNYPQEPWLLPRYGVYPNHRAVADNVHNERRTVEAPEPKSFSGTLLATNGEVFPYNNIRLPSTVLPVSYTLHMFPNLTSFTFEGSAEITFTTTLKTDVIVYHRAVSILITGLVMKKDPELEVDGCGSESLVISKNLENLKHEQGYLKLAKPLSSGTRYKLKFRFTGRLTRALKGFYRSRYFNKNKEMWFAVTDFEATDARRAFPCFDEPAMKATFQVVMARDASQISLSNTPIENSHQLKSGLYADTFQRTVKMSTYLVGFSVSDFAKLEAETSTGIKVATHAPRDQICQTQLALDVAVVILEHYEKFFGIPYPLPKMDMISVRDFSAGAMENWGMVTFAENSFLYDPETSSSYRRQRVAVVVAHEFAHQWFGNLVTMKWWNDIWLNEGFASFVEYIGTDKWNKDWKMLDQFIPETLLRALRRDSYTDSHPISVDVKDPVEIRSLFDTISYSKGASIIRMLESFMGSETLTKGLKTYLNKFKYGNAVTNDLWDVLSETLENKVNVKQVMNSWTNQMGYPLITLDVRDDSVVIANQTRYLLDADNPSKTKFVSTYKWYVPVTYKTDKGVSGIQWMNLYDSWFRVPKGTKWVKANNDMLGFYRVQYNIDNWRALAKQLETDYRVFSASDRANLLTDSFEFTITGHLNISVVLDLTRYLGDEPDFVPWSIATDSLESIDTHIAGLKRTSQRFRYYANDIMDPILQSLVWDNSATHIQQKLREMLLVKAIKWNHQGSVKKAIDYYNVYRKTGEIPSSDILYVSLRAAVENSKTDREYEFVMNKFKNSKSSSTRRTFLAAAATTKNETLRQRFMTSSLDKSLMSVGEFAYSLYYIAGASEEGRKSAFRFMVKNWNTYHSRLGQSNYYMYWLVVSTSFEISTDCEQQEMKEFFAKNLSTGYGSRAVQECLRKIDFNMSWRKLHQKDVANWLSNYFR